ncbi:hypothetical protein V8F20_002918 [Naviculisporaceae sp. PSN 640]
MASNFSQTPVIETRLRELENARETTQKGLERLFERMAVVERMTAILEQSLGDFAPVTDFLHLEHQQETREESIADSKARMAEIRSMSVTNYAPTLTNTTEEARQTFNTRLARFPNPNPRTSVLPVLVEPAESTQNVSQVIFRGLTNPCEEVSPPPIDPTQEPEIEQVPENEASSPPRFLLHETAFIPLPNDPIEVPNLGVRYLALLQNMRASGVGLETALHSLQDFLWCLGTIAVELALFTHQRKDTLVRRSYFLKVIGPNGFGNAIFPSLRKKLTDMDEPQSAEEEDRVKRTGILEWVAETTGNSRKKVTFPKYVLCLGEMYVRTDNFSVSINPRSMGDKWEIDKIKSTNYFVMLDAVNFKAVWLVWRFRLHDPDNPYPPPAAATDSNEPVRERNAPKAPKKKKTGQVADEKDTTARGRKKTVTEERSTYWEEANLPGQTVTRNEATWSSFQIDGARPFGAVKLVDDIEHWNPCTPGQTAGLMLDEDGLIARIMSANATCKPIFIIPRWEDMRQIVGGGGVGKLNFIFNLFIIFIISSGRTGWNLVEKAGLEKKRTITNNLNRNLY